MVDRAPGFAIITPDRRWSVREVSAAADVVAAELAAAAVGPGEPGETALASKNPKGPTGVAAGWPVVAHQCGLHPAGAVALAGIAKTGALLAPMHAGWTRRERAGFLAATRPAFALTDPAIPWPVAGWRSLAIQLPGLGALTLHRATSVPAPIADVTGSAAGGGGAAGRRLAPPDLGAQDVTGSAAEGGGATGRPLAPPHPGAQGVNGSAVWGGGAVLATSGSGGVPKLAVHGWSSLHAGARAASERLGFGAGGRWLATLGWAHVGGLAVWLRAALTGGTVGFADAPRFEAGSAGRALHELAITHLSLVPAMLHGLLDAGARPPGCLRAVLLGGAATPPDLADRALSAGWPIALTYGLTEAGSQVTTATPDEVRAGHRSAGRPLPGLQVRIRRSPAKAAGGPRADVDRAAAGDSALGGDGAAPPDGSRAAGVDSVVGGDTATGPGRNGATEAGGDGSAAGGDTASGGADAGGAPSGNQPAETERDRKVGAGGGGSPEIGEIEIRGAMLFRGYLGEPSRPREGWFATGDLGRLDSDGRLTVTGRKSDRIVSGGENVDPAAVEAALAEHADVREAVVLGLPDARWGEIVTAVIVGEGPHLASAVDRWCRRRLSGARIPRRWFVRDRLPRTATGKVDRAALIADLGGSVTSPSSPLACQKDLFQIDEGAHFLNCAYLGPLPRSVAEAGIAGIRGKLSPTPFPSSEFFTGVDRARERFGRLVNAPPERIALIASAAYGVAVAARNLPLETGQNIVLLGEQFPSNVYAWRRLAAENDGEVRTVHRPGPPPSGALWNERLLEAIDPSTAVVALPHCHWTDGTRIDLEAAGRRAREVGAALIIDASQSIGAVPFDVARLRPDALITVGYKWIMGPYSTALAYFGPRFDNGIPLEECWISRRGAEDFQALVDYADEYRDGAVRYDVGQTSNFILIPMLIEALDLVLAWDPARILAYCKNLLAGLAAEIRGWGWAMEDDEWRAGHILGVRLPRDIGLRELESRLADARVYASLRGDALRVSPNIYNETRDVDALRQVLSAFS